MDKKTKACLNKLQDLISEVQGAPFPTDIVQSDLYQIWYEHAQRSVVSCIEFVGESFPKEQKEEQEREDEMRRAENARVYREAVKELKKRDSGK